MTTEMTIAPDPAQIKRTLTTLFPPDAVIELRALHKGRKRTDAGYFDADHRRALIDEAVKLNRSGAAVYVTMNAIDPQLLARHANRVQEFAPATATDHNITRRHWLLIDMDPQRPKDTSATPEQLALVMARGKAVHAYLASKGWPAPVSADSGNGLHFFYRIDLPNDDESRDLVKHCLEALAARFDDDAVKIDRSVFNAARIVKLHGTVATKGDNLPSAPWRLSKLRSCPESLQTLTREQLQALAGEVSAPKTNGSKPSAPGLRSWTEADVQDFLARGGIEATGPEPHDGASRWKLKACPFNPDHGYGEAAVFLRPDGRLGFECRHNSCQDKHWQDLRTLIDGERTSRVNGSAGKAGGFVGFAGADGSPSGTPWYSPLPLDDALPPVEIFAQELLPDALRPWVLDVAERTQAPVEYVAVSAMVSLGAALGRKVGLRPKRLDDWCEMANLWGAVIGPPSWMKSPALDEGKRPLAQIEARELENFEHTRREWEMEAEAAKARRDGARDMARAAARKNESFDKAKLIADVVPEEPKPPRSIVNNATVPALCEVLRANPSGVLVYRDELAGLIAELDSEGMEGSRSFYLSAWSGKEGYVEDRIGRGTNLRVPFACLSLLGGIQPSRVAPLLKESIATGGGDGFLARFSLIVWPDSPGEYRSIDREPDVRARDAAYRVFQRLHQLEPANIGAELLDGAAPFLRLEPGASEAFTEWDVELRNRLRSGLDDGAMAAHLGKYPKAVCALALLSHLADGGTGAVSEQAVLRALAWSEFLESHARRVYASLGQSHVDAARSLLNRIKRGDLSSPFTLREVYIRGWAHLSDAQAARSAAEVLEGKGYVRSRTVEGSEAGGRPTVKYDVNPAILAVRP